MSHIIPQLLRNYCKIRVHANLYFIFSKKGKRLVDIPIEKRLSISVQHHGFRVFQDIFQGIEHIQVNIFRPSVSGIQMVAHNALCVAAGRMFNLKISGIKGNGPVPVPVRYLFSFFKFQDLIPVFLLFLLKHIFILPAVFSVPVSAFFSAWYPDKNPG